MRRRLLVGCLAVAFCAPLAAASVAAQKKEAGQPESCSNPRAIGVSRTIEIDTKGGINLGTQQYKGFDPLKDGEVVLTFDDGPLRRNTRKVLKALADHCTKATFFAVGAQAVADPDMLRKVAAAGHTIAHHTWSHKNQGRRSTSRSIAEF